MVSSLRVFFCAQRKQRLRRADQKHESCDRSSHQADMPREACSIEGRNTVIVDEGHKAQSALLHAQQVADDMYHASLVSAAP